MLKWKQGGLNMWRTYQEEVDIGNKVFNHVMTKTEAMEQFDLTNNELTTCIKKYMKENNIPIIPEVLNAKSIEFPNYYDLSKEELIKEIMKKEIEVERAKKGYTVRGGGKTKEFISIKDANIK